MYAGYHVPATCYVAVAQPRVVWTVGPPAPPQAVTPVIADSRRQQERRRLKSSTLAGWSNLPGKALLFDQLSKLKASRNERATRLPPEEDGCCCQCSCEANRGRPCPDVVKEDSYWTTPAEHPKRTSEWLNVEAKSVRFRLPGSRCARASRSASKPRPASMVGPEIDRDRNEEEFYATDFVRKDAEKPRNEEKKSKKKAKNVVAPSDGLAAGNVIVKTPAATPTPQENVPASSGGGTVVGTLLRKPPKVPKSIFGQRFLVKDSRKLVQPQMNKAPKEVASAASEKMSSPTSSAKNIVKTTKNARADTAAKETEDAKGTATSESAKNKEGATAVTTGEGSDHGYESDPANRAAAAAAEMAAAEAIAQAVADPEPEMDKWVTASTLPRVVPPAPRLPRPRRQSDNSRPSKSVERTKEESSSPVLMRLFAPIRVRKVGMEKISSSSSSPPPWQTFRSRTRTGGTVRKKLGFVFAALLLVVRRPPGVVLVLETHDGDDDEGLQKRARN